MQNKRNAESEETWVAHLSEWLKNASVMSVIGVEAECPQEARGKNEER